MNNDRALIGRPRARGEDGLLPTQRRYFDLLSRNGSKRDACDGVGIKSAQVTRWLRDDPAFLRAHEEFFQSAHDATAARFTELQERLPDIAMELLEANKTIKVTNICSKCSHKDTIYVNTTNDTVRARMWADLMKAAGHLKDIRKIEGDVNITHLSAGQRIALEKLRRGLDVSVQQRKELESMGMLEGLKMYDGSEIIEGEILDVKKETM
ncbi:hypothetical protein LCGC14_0288900 [marine sediment metagenome]|uniref:Terminase small subunit n=1 Tax=marine sediment metagenome TaxID=412755 RepID=A0A0F9WZD2_9ZZZZ